MPLQSLVTFISKLSKRERSILYVTAAVIGIVLLDRLILSPILNKISELNDTISIQEEDIERSMVIVMQEKRIKGESEHYTPYLSQPQTEEKEITAFLKEVENLAKKSSVYLVDIKPSGQDKDDVAMRYYVKVNFEAQMEQVFHFFHNITNYDKLIKIESFDISPKAEGTSVVTCSASISKAIIPE